MITAGSRAGRRRTGTLALAQFGVVSSVPILLAGQNVKSITRHSAGRFTVNFADPLPLSEYGVLVSGRWADSTSDEVPFAGVDRLTGSLYNQFGVTIISMNGSSLFDGRYYSVWCFDPVLL